MKGPETVPRDGEPLENTHSAQATNSGRLPSEDYVEPPTMDRLSTLTGHTSATPCPSLTSTSASLSDFSDTASASGTAGENCTEQAQELETTADDENQLWEGFPDLPQSANLFLVPTGGREDKMLEKEPDKEPVYPPEGTPRGQEDTLADRLMTMEGFVSPEKMTILQQQDPTISKIFKRLEEAKRKPGRKKYPYSLRHGVMIKTTTLKDGRTVKRVVVPFALQNWLLKMVHGDQEHLGSEQMVGILHPAFYWPNMHRDISTFAQSCISCQFSKPSTVKQVEIQHRKAPPAQSPNHKLSIDLITGLPQSSGGHKYILTIVDQFSRFVQCVALTEKTPRQVAKALEERWYGIIGVPGSVHSDQGTEVDSGFMQKVMKILGTRKSRTASYSPQGNGLAEVTNRTIGSLLKSSVFPNTSARFWPKLLPYICLAINESPTVTGYSPRELLLGRTASYHRLPLVSFQNEMVTHDDFLLATRLGQEFMWNVVRAQQDRPRPGKDGPQKSHQYREGDFILLKNLTIGKPGESKLRPRYLGPYRILKAYDAVVLVKRWTGPKDKASSLELLHHHQLDARHADVRLAHIRHIKAFKNPEKIGAGPAINPLIVDHFLKQLGCPQLRSPDSSIMRAQYEWDLAQPQVENSDHEGNSEISLGGTTSPSQHQGTDQGDVPVTIRQEPNEQAGARLPTSPGQDEGSRSVGAYRPTGQEQASHQSNGFSPRLAADIGGPPSPSAPGNPGPAAPQTPSGNQDCRERGRTGPPVNPGMGPPEPPSEALPGGPDDKDRSHETTPTTSGRRDSPKPSTPPAPAREDTCSGSKSSRFDSPSEKSLSNGHRRHSSTPETRVLGGEESQGPVDAQSDPSGIRIQPSRKTKSKWHQNWPDIREQLAP